MNKSIKDRMLKLVNNPFVQGMGSIADIFGPTISCKQTSLQDDMRALRGDWETIGNDMRIAFDLYRKEVSSAR